MWKRWFKRTDKKESPKSIPLKVECDHQSSVIANLYRVVSFNDKNESIVIVYQLLQCFHCKKHDEYFLLEDHFPFFKDGEKERMDELIMKLKLQGFEDEQDFLFNHLDQVDKKVLDSFKKDIDTHLKQTS